MSISPSIGAPLPHGWKRTQLRRLVDIRNGRDYKAVEVAEGGYPVYGSGGEFRRASDFLHDGESILFGRKGTVDRPLYVDGKFWTVDTMYYAVPLGQICVRFLYYFSTTIPFSYYVTSTAVPSVTQSDLAGHPVNLPPLDEQRAIADYLDRETQKIDELIAEQRDLIETLWGRRKSVVSNTIDATTNSVKLKYILSRDRPLTYGIVQAGPPVDEGVPYIGPSDIVNHQVVGLRELRKTSPMIETSYKRSRVQQDDVVVSIGPAYGKTTMIPVELAGANLTQDTARVSCDAAKALPRYVQWVLMSDSAHEFWNSRIMGATFRRLNLDVLAQTPIPLPSIGEQCDIAAYLDEQTSRIDVLISESEDLIALSEERRSALIIAAVTGQIDVRNAS